MKNLLAVLILILVLNTLLGACSDKSTPPAQPSPPTTGPAQTPSDDGVDFTLLKEFVNAINDQYVEGGLNLFNDEATLNEIDQVALMTNLHQNGWNHMYSGKGEIGEWLKVEISSNAQIVPGEYKLYGNYLSMDGFLYYQDQVIKLQLIIIPENSKINLLIYYVKDKKYF
jgi:hypothetical protein